MTTYIYFCSGHDVISILLTAVPSVAVHYQHTLDGPTLFIVLQVVTQILHKSPCLVDQL